MQLPETHRTHVGSLGGGPTWELTSLAAPRSSGSCFTGSRENTNLTRWKRPWGEGADVAISPRGGGGARVNDLFADEVSRSLARCGNLVHRDNDDFSYLSFEGRHAVVFQRRNAVADRCDSRDSPIRERTAERVASRRSASDRARKTVRVAFPSRAVRRTATSDMETRDLISRTRV